jgi:hypothetical protein
LRKGKEVGGGRREKEWNGGEGGVGTEGGVPVTILYIYIYIYIYI